MSLVFAETLRSMREEKGYSQQLLAEKIFVNRSTVSKWEAGTRLPDLTMIYRIAKALGVDVNTFLYAAQKGGGSPNIILVDDEKIFLNGGIPVLYVLDRYRSRPSRRTLLVRTMELRV